MDFLFTAGSLTCEGRTGWASEVTIHVYEESVEGGGGVRKKERR